MPITRTLENTEKFKCRLPNDKMSYVKDYNVVCSEINRSAWTGERIIDVKCHFVFQPGSTPTKIREKSIQRHFLLSVQRMGKNRVLLRQCKEFYWNVYQTHLNVSAYVNIECKSNHYRKWIMNYFTDNVRYSLFWVMKSIFILGFH